MLLALMARSDEGRLDRYLRESYTGLVARLRGSFAARVGAEDMVQEALVRAWLIEARGERIHSLSPWMTAAATNLARSRWRTLQAEARALERAGADLQREGAPTLDPADTMRLEGPLAEAVRGLPRRQAQAVLLHHLGDLSIRETGARMGVSEGTVKRALHDARERLGRALDQDLRDRRRHTMIGWHMAGSQPGQYDHELTGKTAYGRPVARLRFTAEKPEGFGTLMQTRSAPTHVRGLPGWGR